MNKQDDAFWGQRHRSGGLIGRLIWRHIGGIVDTLRGVTPTPIPKPKPQPPKPPKHVIPRRTNSGRNST